MKKRGHRLAVVFIFPVAVFFLLLLLLLTPVRGKYSTSDCYDVQLTGDGGFIITGTYFIEEGEQRSGAVWLVKVDGEGKEEWERVFPAREKWVSVKHVVQTCDGGFLIRTTGSLLIKTDASGNKEWEKMLQGEIGDLYAAEDGGIIVAGTMNGMLWKTKLNHAGDVEWEKTVDNREYGAGLVVKISRDGGFFLSKRDVLPTPVSWISKVDAEGDILWERTFKAEAFGLGQDMEEAPDGGFVLVLLGDRQKGTDVLLVRLDSNGNTEWERSLGLWSSFDIPHRIVARSTASGGYVIVGATRASGSGPTDIFVQKTHPGGDNHWSIAVGGQGYDGASSIKQTPDGGYIIAGFTESFRYSGGAHRGWLIKIDSEGNEQWNNVLGLSDFAEMFLQPVWGLWEG